MHYSIHLIIIVNFCEFGKNKIALLGRGKFRLSLYNSTFLISGKNNKICSPSFRLFHTVHTVNLFSLFQPVQEEQTYDWKLMESVSTPYSAYTRFFVFVFSPTPFHFFPTFNSMEKHSFGLGGIFLKRHVTKQLHTTERALKEAPNCDFIGIQLETKLNKNKALKILAFIHIRKFLLGVICTNIYAYICVIYAFGITQWDSLIFFLAINLNAYFYQIICSDT